jgi:TonB family protein
MYWQQDVYMNKIGTAFAPRVLLLSLVFGMMCQPSYALAKTAKGATAPAGVKTTHVDVHKLEPYLQTVKSRLDHCWFPAAAAKGHATVMFRVYKDGRIYWMELADASGTPAVNQSAEDAVSNASPLPPLPAGSPDNVDITVTFDSHLENSTQVHYSRPNPDRVRQSKALLADANKDLANKAYSSALDKLQNALQLTPFDSRVRDRLVEASVLCAGASKDDEEYFLQTLHQALIVSPHNASVLAKLDAYWKSKGKDPASFDTRVQSARDFAATGRPVDALAEYVVAYSIKPDNALVPEINAVCKVQEAFRNVQKWKAIVDRSRTAENMVALAKAYEQCGDTANAKTFYQASLDRDNNCEPARQSLAMLSQPAAAPNAVPEQQQLSDIFPLANDGKAGLSVHVVQNRLPSVDYYQWACTGNAVHRWTPGRFPLRLYVESGRGVPGWLPQYDKMVADCLASWCAASENRITFALVPNKLGANITCKWTNKPEQITIGNAQGVTNFQYMHWGGGANKGQQANDTIRQGDITILTVSRQDGSALDPIMMKSVCLHEIGHALGLAGHSPYDSDIMYPSLSPDSVTTSLTYRDKNTIKHLYQGYEHQSKK